MEVLLYSVIFVTVTYFTLIAYSLAYSGHRQVSERLGTIRDMNGIPGEDDDDELREPFADRVLKPAFQRLVQAISNAAPTEIKKRYEELIVSSGSSSNVTFSGILMMQVMVGLVMMILAFLLFRVIGSKVNTLVVFLFGVIGFAFPYVSLHSKSVSRKEKILVALPDMLDLLYVSVEAGLAFDMAMKKASEKMRGPLSDEISRALLDISKGREREESMRAMAARSKVDDLTAFVTSVIQAEQLGSNIANVLRIQSVTMRQSRRQRAQELAAKIPVKMLFPLVFFLFPALFVVILGPAAINIFETMSKM